MGLLDTSLSEFALSTGTVVLVARSLGPLEFLACGVGGGIALPGLGCTSSAGPGSGKPRGEGRDCLGCEGVFGPGAGLPGGNSSAFFGPGGATLASPLSPCPAQRISQPPPSARYVCTSPSAMSPC